MYEIILVDDDKIFLEAVSYSLSPVGKVFSTSSPEEAVELIMNGHGKVVLMDLRIGQKNGIDYIEQIKKNRPEIVVYLITGFLEKDSAVRALRAKVDDIFEKPISLNELRELIQTELLKDMGFKLDNFSHEIIIGSDKFELTPTEFQIVSILKNRGGRPIKKHALIQSLWGEKMLAKNNFDTHVHNLRKKVPHLKDGLACSPEGYFINLVKR